MTQQPVNNSSSSHAVLPSSERNGCLIGWVTNLRSLVPRLFRRNGYTEDDLASFKDAMNSISQSLPSKFEVRGGICAGPKTVVFFLQDHDPDYEFATHRAIRELHPKFPFQLLALEGEAAVNDWTAENKSMDAELRKILGDHEVEPIRSFTVGDFEVLIGNDKVEKHAAVQELIDEHRRAADYDTIGLERPDRAVRLHGMVWAIVHGVLEDISNCPNAGKDEMLGIFKVGERFTFLGMCLSRGLAWLNKQDSRYPCLDESQLASGKIQGAQEKILAFTGASLPYLRELGKTMCLLGDEEIVFGKNTFAADTLATCMLESEKDKAVVLFGGAHSVEGGPKRASIQTLLARRGISTIIVDRTDD